MNRNNCKVFQLNCHAQQFASRLLGKVCKSMTGHWFVSHKILVLCWMHCQVGHKKERSKSWQIQSPISTVQRQNEDITVTSNQVGLGWHTSGTSRTLSFHTSTWVYEQLFPLGELWERKQAVCTFLLYKQNGNVGSLVSDWLQMKVTLCHLWREDCYSVIE